MLAWDCFEQRDFMIRKIELTVILFILWLILSGKYEPFLIILGVLSSICVAWIAHRMELADPEGFPIQLGPKAIIYWPWLIWEIVKANIDVALIIIKPKLEIQPIIFTTDASQKTDVGIVTYANSITLTPGTITVAVPFQHTGSSLIDFKCCRRCYVRKYEQAGL